MSKTKRTISWQKLTRAQRWEIERIIREAKGDGKPHSAQDSIPFEMMYPDGFCRLNEKSYSKCIEFEDINYQLAGANDKTATFENLCDFHSYYDAFIGIQLSLTSRYANKEDFEQSIEIPLQGDDLGSIWTKYIIMPRGQPVRGNNGLTKTKFLIPTIEADNIQAARSRLTWIGTDSLNHFKVMGAAARVLNGKQRLTLLHGIFHPDDEEFTFEWGRLPRSGLSVKDFITPSSFQFGNSRTFRMGKKLGAASFLQTLVPELNDRMPVDLIEADSGIITNPHVRSIDQNEVIKTIKRRITDLDAMEIAEQKKAVRSSYDMDIILSDLATYGGEAKSLLHGLQSRNGKMFLLVFLVLSLVDTKRKLENAVLQASGVAQKYNYQPIRLDFQQEAGLMSSLPLGLNQIHIQRGPTMGNIAIFAPFTTQELLQNGEALCYGLNALSNNIILADRKELKNPNGLILGTPGSGKSFSAKGEIANVFLITQDDIIICDPEVEYFSLVGTLHGQVIRISPTSTQHVNPTDINLNYSEDDSPLALKSDFILSLCELVAGGKNGLEPVEKTVIDRTTRNMYRGYLADPKPENMSVLQDLYNEVKRQPEPETQCIASALELYVTDSLNVFNHRINVDIENRLACFDIKEFGKQLKKLGILVTQDQVWNHVTANRVEGKATRYYMDESHLLLKEEQTAAHSVEIWKRFRKWGGIPTGITRNVKDLLASREMENIFENSDPVYMLSQAAGDREILAKQLNISLQQPSHVTHSEAGEGFISYGNVILPFVDRFPQDTELYRIMTTKPKEAKGENWTRKIKNCT